MQLSDFHLVQCMNVLLLVVGHSLLSSSLVLVVLVEIFVDHVPWQTAFICPIMVAKLLGRLFFTHVGPLIAEIFDHER